MKEKLNVTAYFVCFQGESTGKVENYSIRWKGVLTNYHDEVVLEHSRDCEPTVLALFKDLQSWFGGELKDLNNEVHVEISSPQAPILIGATTMATKKYYIKKPLAIEDLSELAAMLNALEQRTLKRDMTQKLTA